VIVPAAPASPSGALPPGIVTEMTVRRELDELQRRGLVRRVRGGAVPVDAAENGFAARAG